jgi:hypothetical protein
LKINACNPAPVTAVLKLMDIDRHIMDHGEIGHDIWTTFNCLKIVSSSRLLWTWRWISRVHWSGEIPHDLNKSQLLKEDPVLQTWLKFLLFLVSFSCLQILFPLRIFKWGLNCVRMQMCPERRRILSSKT